MFTGIVEGAGKVRRVRLHRSGARLTIETPPAFRPLTLGASVAVNGCCLTVASRSGRSIATDLSSETLRVTNLGQLVAGDRVNLERPVRLSDRLGGHLVQGHIDGVGRIRSIQKNGDGVEIAIAFPPSLRRYMIPKGSVAVDGISMTVNRLTARQFRLVVIPHTLKKTNLGGRRPGDRVNLEVDMVGKYIESLMRK